MSWDLIVFARTPPLEQGADGTALFPADWEPANIGPLEHIRTQISRAFPQTQWSDPAWGVLVDPAFSLEFNIGQTQPCPTFTIHARGLATDAALHLTAVTDWAILDTGTNKWLHLSPLPDEGRAQFQSYLDTVRSTLDSPAKPKGFWARLLRR